jgi:hypothetical protein
MNFQFLVATWHRQIACPRLPFFRCPPDDSSTKNIDMEMLCRGGWNAVAYWGDISLHGEITISTGGSIILSEIIMNHL